ncbi:hypothetical protein LMIY3S_01132 [Labrys miyagiensis]
MPRVTHYLVVPFARDLHGELLGLGPEEAPDAATANFRAFNMMRRTRRVPRVVGTIAYARSGDPATGAFDDAVILARYGETPGAVKAIK